MDAKVEFFKVRRKSDGQFYEGRTGRFGSVGKVYSSVGHAKLGRRAMMDYKHGYYRQHNNPERQNKIMSKYEIVKYEAVEVGVVS